MNITKQIATIQQRASMLRMTWRDDSGWYVDVVIDHQRYSTIARDLDVALDDVLLNFVTRGAIVET